MAEPDPRAGKTSRPARTATPTATARPSSSPATRPSSSAEPPTSPETSAEDDEGKPELPDLGKLSESNEWEEETPGDRARREHTTGPRGLLVELARQSIQWHARAMEEILGLTAEDIAFIMHTVAQDLNQGK